MGYSLARMHCISFSILNNWIKKLEENALPFLAPCSRMSLNGISNKTLLSCLLWSGPTHKASQSPNALAVSRYKVKSFLTDNFEIFTCAVLQEKGLNWTFSLQLLENSSRCPKCRYPICQESELGVFAKVKVIILMSKQVCQFLSCCWCRWAVSESTQSWVWIVPERQYSLPRSGFQMNNNLVQHIDIRWMTQPTPQSQPWDFSI